MVQLTKTPAYAPTPGLPAQHKRLTEQQLLNTVPFYPSDDSFIWNEITTSQVMDINNGYICNNSSLVQTTLPPVAVFGNTVRVGGKGAGGWQILQNARQQIHCGSQNTTMGVGGSIQNQNTFDAIELLCISDNTDWLVLSIQGNLTII